LDIKSYELGENDIFKGLSQDAIKFFCNLSEIKIYNDEIVDMASGGIVFSGTGFVPEGEETPRNQVSGLLKFIAPGSGNYQIESSSSSAE